MKVATAFYDSHGCLLPMPKYWEGDHDTAGVLTTDGGYWHSCVKYFGTQAIRDAIAAEMIQAICDSNGTVFTEYRSSEAVPIDSGVLAWSYSVEYVIEEPARGRCYQHAATSTSYGQAWLDEAEQFDPVAEYGPDYVDELTGNPVLAFAHSVDALISAKAKALSHEHRAEKKMLEAVQAQTQVMREMLAAQQAVLGVMTAPPKAKVTRTLTGDKARQWVRDNPDKY